MKIALINGWPNLVESDEIRFIRRFRRAAEKLGHEAFEVVTSGDILACSPDFAIALSDISPKLTSVPTFGAMWSPPLSYHGDALRTRSILSYDGFLVGSEPIRQYLGDLEFSLGIEKPKSDFLFVPAASFDAFEPWSAHAAEGAPPTLSGRTALEREVAAAVTGEAIATSPGGSYDDERAPPGRGRIVLCLHTDQEREADVPSPRLFEAAVAGAVIITDELPFSHRVLGTAALYVDSSQSRAALIEQIRAHLAALHSDAALGARLVQDARDRLAGRFDIETIVARCCNFAAETIEAARASTQVAVSRLQRSAVGETAAAELERPLVDVIMRAGGRPLASVRRALGSIARQQEGSYRVLLVDYKGREDLAQLAREHVARNTTVTYLRSKGTGFRSTSLCAGLAHVEAPFFAILDDDDSVAPDHFASLLELASRNPDCGLFYSGTIRIEDDGAPVVPPNFAGPLGLSFREDRQLMFLDPPDLARLLAFDNYITSNSFIARRELLDEAMLRDPELEVAEDVHLLLLLAAKTSFRSTLRATALWHRRSDPGDNSMTASGARAWQRDTARIAHRLRHMLFPAAAPFWRLRNDAPFVLPLGTFTSLDAEVVRHSEARGLHAGEPEGVWTSGTRSFIRLLLNDFIQQGHVLLEFGAAVAPHEAPQEVQISLDDETIFAGPVNGWDRIRVEAPFAFARPRNVVFLTVECDRTMRPDRFGPMTDERDLGVFLSKLRIDKAS